MKDFVVKLARLFTRNGRQSLVRGILAEELDRAHILGYIGDAILHGVRTGINGVSPARLAVLHSSLSVVNGSVERLLKATDPQSEDGFGISDGEAEVLRIDFGLLARNLLTDDVVASLHDAIVSRVP